MFSLNKKGQSFSVFQLLISAIIALAILVFLLQIFSQLPGLGQSDPTAEAVSKIKSALSFPGTPEISNKVTFEPNKPLSARTIATGTGSLSNDKVCLTSAGSESAFDVTGNILVYKGGQKVDRKLYILCDVESQISTTVDELRSSLSSAENALENFGNDCAPLPDGTNKYCVVSVIGSS